MRVVRVWFQNKRCKEKKDRLRQDGWDLVTAQPDTLPSTVRYFQHHCLCTIYCTCMHAHCPQNILYYILHVYTMFKFIPCSIHNDTWSLVPDIMHNNIESSISSQAGPILFNPYLPHSSMLTGTPRMDGIAHESFYCNQPYAALTTTSPRHLQYATPVPQYPSPTSAPPMSLPSTAHTLYYNMSHVPGGSFPISRCSLIEAGTVGPTSPYSVVSACLHVTLQ